MTKQEGSRGQRGKGRYQLFIIQCKIVGNILLIVRISCETLLSDREVMSRIGETKVYLVAIIADQLAYQ